MRYRLLIWLAVAPALGATLTAGPAYADFDPSGRGKKKPGGTKPGTTKPGGTKPGTAKPGGTPTKPGTTKPGGAEPGNTTKPGRPEDAEAGRSPDVLIPRYMAIVLAQPGSPFPLQRLAQLYRDRDGNLKKLVEDLQAKATGTDDTAFAAKVALAGVLKQDGRYEESIKSYEAAIAERPKEPGPILALAQLEVDRGDKAKARGHYEKALPLLKNTAEVEQTTRTLMGLALDTKDFDAAKKFHQELVAKSQGSLFVKAELGRELFTRKEFARAETEFRDLVKAAAGDNRALAPALKDLGHVLAKQKKMAEALETLKKAMKTAAAGAGIRAEIMAIMTEAYRAEGKLTELVTILEAEPGQDFHRLATLGSLYEETGNVEKALATYRKAVGVDSRNIDVRVKLVHLLQTAGDLEGAIKEYEGLIKSAPNNPEYVFELCETLIQRGDRPKALKLLKELEGRSASDADVLAAVADFYERVEEKDRAMAVLQKLAGAAGGDPTFLVDLGDRYYQTGDKKKALDTWARIRGLVPNKARASFMLGEVYLDHDMPEEALASLREATTLEPGNAQFKKALAIALERTAPGTPVANERFGEAVTIWQDLLANAKKDDNLAREARTHIVSIWSVTKELTTRVPSLKARFEQTPPDLESGRLLAEVYRKLAKLPEAEATLRQVAKHAPGDEQSLLALERILVLRTDLSGAIDVLEKLTELNPKAARQYFQRMAQYAAELYRDDDAIRFAAKAVELSPEDAGGHQKLGDMYRKRQDYPHAISEYRQAIQKNDRLFPVYFDLAELLMSTSEVDEADLLFRRVMRSSPDEELVVRAARLSMQINLGKSSLETLERELLPVAVGNPHKPIYRRLLVELYGTMTMPLVQKLKQSTGEKREEARTQLAAIGSRAVKPLLDALGDERESQQRVAIDVLAHVENKGAGPSLFNFAVGAADKNLRVRAMIACGALGDPDLLPKLSELLLPKSADSSVVQNDDLALAAAWGIARTRGAKAEEVLNRLLAAPSADVRGVAAVGLGLTKNKKHLPRLVAVARSPESGPVSRAAALFAALELSVAGERGTEATGSKDAEAVRGIAQNFVESTDIRLRRAGLLTLARLSPKESSEVVSAIAPHVFSSDASLRRDAVAALSLLPGVATATGSSGKAPATERRREPLAVPDGALRAAEVVDAFAPEPATDSLRLAALVFAQRALESAATSSLAAASSKADGVALALDQPILGPFAPASRKGIDPALLASAEAATEAIRAASIAAFAQLVQHPDVDTRVRAVEMLAKRREPEAEAALLRALGDADETVVRATLVAMAGAPSAHADKVIRNVIKIAKSGDNWALRARAAEALARTGEGARGEAVTALLALAKADKYALVREAALRSLSTLDRNAANALLREVEKSDPEPRLRLVAQELLGTRTKTN